MNEFEIIARFWSRTEHREDVSKGIGDDCAVVVPPPQQVLLISSDTLNEDVHFFKDNDPYQLGYKSLAVSLSDLAAMGGEPAWFLLNVSLPQTDRQWLEAFTQGMFDLAHEFHLQLIGGDTTYGPLSITSQVTGFAPPDQVIYRSGALPGDLLYVTGSLGQAALAVRALKREIGLTSEELAEAKVRLNTPSPRITEGMLLRGIASAAIDLSDGLAADLTHILQQSSVGACVNADKLPLSSLLQKLPIDLMLELALTGGDDYELLFTVPPAKQNLLAKIQTNFSCPITQIGYITEGSELKIMARDREIKLSKLGYTHFESS